MNVKDRVAVVTGAAQGIGRACALRLAAAGARVAIVDVIEPKLNAVVEEIRAQGGEALGLKTDITAEAEIKAGFQQVLESYGKLEILVNNAGIARDHLALRMRRADWQAVLDTNLTGAFLCAQQALPTMIKQRYGRIINITSVVALMGNPGQANYVASKAGLIGLTKALAAELAARNITVNAVAPGFIATPMTESLPEKVKQEYMARIPLGRMGTDEDVAYAVLFLASDEAGYITGHILSVNGGMYM